MDDGTRYLPIADLLRQRIRSGELAEGAQLPSIPELMREHGVSNAVARKVLRTLVNEGIAVARAGSGTYVRQHPKRQVLVRSWHRNARGGSPFAIEMAGQARIGHWDYTSRTAIASDEIRQRLALESSDCETPDVIETKYVFRGDNEPVQLSTSWEPLSLVRETPIVLPEEGPHAGKGVADRMRQIGIVVTHAAELVSARLVSAPEARLLEVPTGDIVVTIARTYYADTRPIETADIVIPVARYAVLYGTSTWDAPLGTDD